MKKVSKTASVIFSAMAVGSMLVASSAKAEEKVEVLNWWTSGGEAKALGTLKDILQKEGVTWTDMPVAGGGGANAMTVLKARVNAGNPPTAVQLLGFDMHDWAAQGVMNDLSAVAKEQHWDDVVYPAYQNYNKYDGKWVSVPVNVHSANWLWMNKATMDKLGIKDAPKSWDELIADLEKAKAAGITPIAHGGQPWQDATVFEDVVLSTGGIDFYKKALVDLDPAALGSDTMKKSFDRVSQLRGYFDSGFSGRDWNLATAMVIKGDALMQFMGDWAKGEFVAANKTPGTDYVCARFPGTQGDVTFTGDAFGMFKVSAGDQDAQNKFAAAILDPKFQITFNKIKGSIPVRMDIPDTEFDACAKKGMADMKEASSKGTAIGSLAHGFAAPAAVKNAVFDVVTKQLNGEVSSQDAVTQLVAAVAAAK